MLLGMDVSKWQGEMNWHKARSAGARFAFVRAGSIDNISGNCYTDYQFERNAKIAPDYMPIGFYWYFRPNHDPLKQANYFCSLIRGKRYVMPPVIDLETTGGLMPFQITDAAKEFIIEVYNRLNVWCLMYARALWLNEHTISHELWKILDLWIARYKRLAGPWSDGYCIPRDYENWKFWQFSADGNGRGQEFGAAPPPNGGRSMDLNYFNGDEKDLNLYIGASVAPHIVKVTSALAASLRSGPEGPAIGATWRGATWPVLGLSTDKTHYRVEAWIKADSVEEV